MFGILQKGKQLYLHFLLLTAGALFPLVTYASHIIGGEIRYQCLGNNKYRVLLDVYRDCYFGQAPFDSPAHISIFTGAGVFVNNLNLPVLASDTIPNNIAGDPCAFPPDNICVEHARYEGVVTLQMQTGGYYFVYQRCCRNKTITNIYSPDSTGATYFVYLSQYAMGLCNSSPEFGFSPPVFVCVNKPIVHPTAAIDLNGDSLVYSFYTPFKGATFSHPQPPFASAPPYDTVNWRPPYNLDYIMAADPVLSIDQNTGLITGTPKAQGQYVVGVMVEEYRDGVLLSRIRRDFQYNVGVCLSIDATIDAADAQCDNLAVQFLNGTQVANEWLWYFQWPDTTIFSTQKTPVYTYPDTGSYTVALIAQPGSQCVDTTFHDIYLQNNSLTPDFSFTTFDCDEESVLLLSDLSTDSISPVIKWNWVVDTGDTVYTSNLKKPVFLLPNPSDGTITLTAFSQNGCEQTISQPFETGNNNPADFLTDKEVCLGESLELNPTGPVTGFTYIWDPPVSIFQKYLPNPIVSPSVTTTYTVTVQAFSNLCQVQDTIKVEVAGLPELDFSYDTDCDARIVTFSNNSSNAPDGFVWDFGDPDIQSDTSTLENPTYTFQNFGTYPVSLITAPTALCKDTLTLSVEALEKILEPGYTFDYSGCSENSVEISFFDQTVNNLNNTSKWHWTFEGVFNGTADEANPVLTITQEGELIVVLNVLTDEDCPATRGPDTLKIDLVELPGIDDDDEELGCLNGGVTLNPGGNPDYEYQWSPSEWLSCTNCPSPFANPDQTTTYTVIVRAFSADTCELARTITVFVPEDPGLSAGDDVLTCEPQASLSASLNAANLQIAWFANGTQIGTGAAIDVPVSGQTVYTVVATDTHGCNYFDSTTVAGGPVEVETEVNEVVCSNEELAVFVQNLDANDLLTYQWSPPSLINGPTDVPNPDIIQTPGIHTLYLEASNQFGCTFLDSLQLVVIDSAIQLDFASQVGCDGYEVAFTNLSVAAFGFVWDFGDPSTSADISYEENPVYTYPDTGIYEVTLTINFFTTCVDTILNDIVIVEPIFNPDFTYEYATCDQDSIQVQFFDTSINFLNNTSSSQWVTSNGQTASIPDPVFTVYPGENLNVTLTIGTENNCEKTVSKEIEIEFIEENISEMVVLCLGDTTALNPGGNTNYQYYWTPDISISDPTDPNPIVWPSQTTVYSVEITNFSADTCTINKEVTVFVPEALTIESTSDTLSCGGPVELSAQVNATGAEINWYDEAGLPIGVGPIVQVEIDSDTWFTVEAVDEYGCKTEKDIFIAEEAVDIEVSPSAVECPDKIAELSVTNLIADHFLEYKWQTTPPGQINSPLDQPEVSVTTPPAGMTATYSVSVINQHGCTASQISEISSLDFVPSYSPFIEACAGDTVQLNPGADISLTYNWTPETGLFPGPEVPNPFLVAQQSSVFTVLISGNFANTQCSESFEVELSVPEPIEISGIVDTLTCGEPLELTVQTNVPADLAWYNLNGELIGSGNTISVLPDSAQAYILVATDNFDCEARDTAWVSNYQLELFLEGNGIIDTCPAPSYNICIENLDPSQELIFQWTASGGGTILSEGDSACPEVYSIPGVLSIFTADVSNQWGCTSTEEYHVETFVFNPVIRDVITICHNVPTPINPDAVGSTYEYDWFPQTGLSCYDCPNPVATLAESQQYFVTVYGFNNEDTCSFTQLVFVKVNPEIALQTNPSDTIICESTEINISATVGSDIISAIEWFDPSGNIIGQGSEVLVFPQGTEAYFVVATDTLGCTDTAHVNIFSHPVDISLDDQFNYCEEDGPQTIAVTNNVPDQQLKFSWIPDEFIIEQQEDGRIITIHVSDTTPFYVTAINQYGCEMLDSITVFYYDVDASIAAEISADPTKLIYNSGKTSQLEITFNPLYFYEWTPAPSLNNAFIHNPIAAPDDTTTYVVVISNAAGCVATRSIKIDVINPNCDEPDIFIPNAFTPNGDGNNDVLYVRSNIVDTIELAIYNRWGQKIYETKNISTGWDGTFEGEELSTDIFGYYLKATCFSGKEFFKKGNISLLR